MKKLLAFLLLATAILLGASQSYVQVVSMDGSSEISQATDLSVYGTFDQSMPTRMAAACQKMNVQGMTCRLDGNTITLSSRFSEGNEYVKVRTEYDIIYVIHTLTVNKLPNDKFQKALIAASGEDGTASDAVDLNEQQANAKLLRQLDSIGLELSYAVKMPEEIESAHSGKYVAAENGETAKFDLKRVYAGSSPLIVRSRGINWAALGVGGAVLVLFFLGALFFHGRANPQKTDYKTRK